VLIPPEPEFSLVHDVTYQKLCRGHALDGSTRSAGAAASATGGFFTIPTGA
jgi:hypothetical protein